MKQSSSRLPCVFRTPGAAYLPSPGATKARNTRRWEPDLELASPPVFDMSGGLARLRGQRGLYLDVLAKFRRTSAGSVVRVRSLLAAGNAVEAARLAHSLKGVAATVGAVQLQRVAAELEAALRQDPAAAEAVVPRLATALETALSSITRLEAEEGSSTDPAPGV